MKVKEESKTTGLKLYIQKIKIMGIRSHHLLANRWGSNGNSERLCCFGTWVNHQQNPPSHSPPAQSLPSLTEPWLSPLGMLLPLCPPLGAGGGAGLLLAASTIILSSDAMLSLQAFLGFFIVLIVSPSVSPVLPLSEVSAVSSYTQVIFLTPSSLKHFLHLASGTTHILILLPAFWLLCLHLLKEFLFLPYLLSFSLSEALVLEPFFFFLFLHFLVDLIKL